MFVYITFEISTVLQWMCMLKFLWLKVRYIYLLSKISYVKFWLKYRYIRFCWSVYYNLYGCSISLYRDGSPVFWNRSYVVLFPSIACSSGFHVLVLLIRWREQYHKRPIPKYRKTNPIQANRNSHTNYNT
jgi:hypothetical protein